MNLPTLIQDLVNAQNSFDSFAYANCFSETAVVFDEGKTHNGIPEIRRWIEHSNQNYQSVMRPLDYSESGTSGTLTAECSGTFDGSPIVLKFHFKIADDKIEQLKVTG